RFAPPPGPVRVLAYAPFRWNYRSALLSRARAGDLQHSTGDSAAIDWLIHAIRCVLDAHAFHQHAVGDFGGSACRRCDDSGFVLADPASSGAAAYGSARESHVGLDMEPVSPCARTGRRPHAENDGRRVRRIPGPLCN